MADPFAALLLQVPRDPAVSIASWTLHRYGPETETLRAWGGHVIVVCKVPARYILLRPTRC